MASRSTLNGGRPAALFLSCTQLRICLLVLLSGLIVPDSRVRAASEPQLKKVGVLTCSGELGRSGIILLCHLQREQEAEATQDEMKPEYVGEIVGRGLYPLISPNGQITWAVLAPQEISRAEAVEGDYDRVSKHSIPFVRSHKNVLVGGQDDLIGLELLDSANVLDSATRLTLRYQGK